MIQAYLACVAFADHCVGTLIDALEAGPIASNTVVVLWSDHGYHLGEKSRMGKTALRDESASASNIRAGRPEAGTGQGFSGPHPESPLTP